jgi:cytochrome c oxidase subunit 2
MARQIVTGMVKGAWRFSWLIAALGLEACGTGGGRWGGGPQSTIQPESDSAQIIQDVYALVTWIDIGIFVIVAGLMLIAMIRYREGRRQDVDIPKQVHGNTVVEIIWTAIPAILLIFIAVPTWQGIFRAAAPPRSEGLRVEAIGHQWWWEFRYPDLGVVTANELHVPVGKPIVIKTFSKDVIHSFWLPRLAAKIDTLPGKSNEVWFTPDKPGKYYGQCAEFCGTSHANMRMLAYVDTPEEFERWVARTKSPPTPATPEAREGQALFLQKGCVACHTIAGVPGAMGVIGPNLTNLKDRTTIAAALFENSPDNLNKWIRFPRELKPGALMALPLPVTEQEAAKLAAFLMSEPSEAAAMVPAPAPAAPAPAAPAPAQPVAPAGGDALALFAAKACIACHIIPGVPGAVGTIGPSLEGLMGRSTIAAGAIPNTPDNLRKWLKNPQGMKPGTLMMMPQPLSDQEIETILGYLQTLK